MQGPLFPIEDDELLKAINDYKNIPDNEPYNVQECKTETLIDEFDAENHMEVIEVDDICMENNENKNKNEIDNKENVSINIQKETEKTVNMFCK